MRNKFFGEVKSNIFDAALQGDIDQIKSLVADGVSVSSANHAKFTPLHLAARGGNLPLVKWLIENGAKINVRTSTQHEEPGGFSPLHLAVRSGSIELVRYLIESGANPNARMGDRSTPLHIAAEIGRRDMIDRLLEAGSDISNCDEMGSNVFWIALMNDYIDLARHLHAKGASIESRIHPHCSTGLMLGSFNKEIEHVRLLLELGADVNAQDDRGLTALHFAVIGASTTVSSYESVDGEVEAKESDPNASRVIIEQLLKHGAGVNIQDNEGMTPSKWGRKLRLNAVADMLDSASC